MASGRTSIHSDTCYHFGASGKSVSELLSLCLVAWSGLGVQITSPERTPILL